MYIAAFIDQPRAAAETKHTADYLRDLVKFVFPFLPLSIYLALYTLLVYSFIYICVCAFVCTVTIAITAYSAAAAATGSLSLSVAYILSQTTIPPPPRRDAPLINLFPIVSPVNK